MGRFIEITANNWVDVGSIVNIFTWSDHFYGYLPQRFNELLHISKLFNMRREVMNFGRFRKS